MISSDVVCAVADGHLIISLMPKLQEIWFVHGPDIRGVSIVTAIVIGLLAVLFAYSRMFDPPSEFVEPVEGVVRTILQVPVPGEYASGSSLWEIQVELADGRKIKATTPILPVIDSKICLALYTKGRWGTRYSAVGDVKSMQRIGETCLDWRPRANSAASSG
jgi:hypothetical protein